MSRKKLSDAVLFKFDCSSRTGEKAYLPITILVKAV